MPVLGRPLRSLGLVRRNRSYRLLFLATLVSGAGTWLAIVALNVQILDATHSGPWIAALNLAAILPSAFIGLLGGPLVDRLSRKRLLVGSDLLRLAVFAGLPFAGRPSTIVALALVAGIGDAFFRPAVLAGLPNLVDAEELPKANFLMTAAQWLTTAVGPLVGGALVAARGPDLAYGANAFSFALSALLILQVQGRLLQSDRSLSRGHWRDLVEGISTVLTSKPLLVVFVVWNIAMIANGGVNVSEVVLATQTLHGGPFGYGLMWAGSGLGLVVGGSFFTEFVRRHSVAATYPLGLAIFGGATVAAGLAPSIWVAAALMVALGFGNGIAVVANVMLVQLGAPDHLRGRAFTVIMSVNYALLGVSFVVAGPLIDHVGPRWIWVGGGSLVVVASAVAAVMVRAWRIGVVAPGAVDVVPEPDQQRARVVGAAAD